MTKIAVIDAQLGGIAGDMFLCALVDCGADKVKIIKKIRQFEKVFAGSIIKDIDFLTTETHGIKATKLHIALEEKYSERQATEMLQLMTKCCNCSKLSDRGKQFVLNSLKAIIKVESVIHNKSPKDLYLHEAASIDTAVDLIGSAVALEDLNLFEDTIFYTTKVAVGGGTTSFSHGVVPNPTNAVLEMLKSLQIPIAGGPVDSELTTPTGVAILCGLNARETLFYPDIYINKIGYGTGIKKFEKIPNLLRVCVGSNINEEKISKDFVTVLETNIDDVSGEILGNLIEKLSSEELGVKDVSIINGLTKKNRPLSVLKVICSEKTEKNVVRIIFEETGTLGIRKMINERYRLERHQTIVPIKIMKKDFKITVKISKDDNGNVINMKPEYEDIKDLANVLGFSYKKTQELVNNLIFQKSILKRR